MYFFFFNDTATTEIYTLSLHDALPILHALDRFTPDPNRWRASFTSWLLIAGRLGPGVSVAQAEAELDIDRKSTRLNSSHLVISYAVFCLKKKNTKPSATYQHVITYTSH